MSEIITYNWDFGDGNSSSLSSPSNTYTSGWYTVELEVLTSLGYYSTVTKDFYIKVEESNLTNFNNDYLEGKTSLHFGWDKETSFGWSENSGDGWVWAESKSSITDFIYLGDKYQLAWDILTDKQYIINTGTGRIGNEVTDKAVSGGDGIDIASSIVMPEFNGEKESYTLSHMETNIFMRSSDYLTDITDDLNTDVSLYDSRSKTSVATSENVSEDGEIVFNYQTQNTVSTSYRQIGIDIDKSGYNLTAIESVFKVLNRSRSACCSTDTVDRQLSSTVSWFSRGGFLDGIHPPMGKDRNTGVISDQYANWSQMTGPDGYTGSAGKPNNIGTGFACSSVADGSDATILTIVQTQDVDSIINGLTFTQYGDKVGESGNYWYVMYYYGPVDSFQQIHNNLPSFYDYRVYNSQLSEDAIKEYYNNYASYMPRF